MFGLSWMEIAIIGAVALVAIGPKDMPAAIRTISGMIKKARRMAAEFQTHVDEMVREANLGEVKDSINAIRNFDFKDTVEQHVDPDHSLRDTLHDIQTPSEAAPDEHVEAVAEPEPTPEPVILAPAFIPPAFAPAPEPAKIEAPEAPAFVPPQYATR